MLRRSRSGSDERRDPVFEISRGAALDLRLSAADRPSSPSDFTDEAAFEPSKRRRAAAPEPLSESEPDGDDPLAETRRRKRRAPKRRGFIARTFYWSGVLAIWAIIAVGGVVGWYAAHLPPIHSLEIPKRPPNITLVGTDGSIIANRGETGGAAVDLGDLPPFLPRAFVAIEDRRFYSHWGVDPLGLARAAVANFRSGNVVQGGSTITQQLAKNLFLTPERNLERKVQEVVLALWLERKYSKDDILELYLNRVYFGAGAYGVEAAAQRYFGKSARRVNISEAAMLAGLVKAPSRLAPTRNPDAAHERAGVVLQAMADEGFIAPGDVKRAFAVAPPAAPADTGSAGFAADWVVDQLDDLVGPYDRDLIVDTTIEPDIQADAEHALAESIAKRGGELGVQQGALVALDTTGAVRALVGGRSYTESQFNRAVAARRQPGSAFKPFVYLTALERGITPDAVRTDAPVQIKGWSPDNFDKKYRGDVTLTQALAMSLNTVAVRLGMEVGPRAVVKTAERLGITSPLQANASIALGTSEVTPLELAAAYVPFANGGYGIVPYAVKRVRTANGKILYERRGSGLGQVINPVHVGMMNAMLEETLRVGTGKKAELPGWQAAGKTGTSQDFRDAWFVGYTGSLVTAVWLGNDDNTPTKKASGSNLPVEIWSRFMQRALAGQQVVGLPGSAAWAARNGTPAVAAGQQQVSAQQPAPAPNSERGQVQSFFDRLFGG
jgi:penicillin-binding protein 1A